MTDPSGREMPRRTPGSIDRLARLAFKAARQRFMPDLDIRHIVAEGFLDPQGGRYMLDFGGYAQLVADGTLFDGAPGRSLDSLRTGGSGRQPDELLSLLRMLAAGSDAYLEGAEEVRGTSCHIFSVRRGGESALTVWIDSEYVRRIRTSDHAAGKPGREQVTLGVTKERTTDLWDFGVSLQDLDWARLPDLRPSGGGVDPDTV
ncbi:MAG TPA: hypothetical protein VJT16_17715 [Streptosporangiaceae bacterium]|nr:hypothetical protein [Streptosporangiaceae bacterium]